MRWFTAVATIIRGHKSCVPSSNCSRFQQRAGVIVRYQLFLLGITWPLVQMDDNGSDSDATMADSAMEDNEGDEEDGGIKEEDKIMEYDSALSLQMKQKLLSEKFERSKIPAENGECTKVILNAFQAWEGVTKLHQ